MAELCNFTPDEYHNYQNSQKMIYDYENTIDFARKQGEAKGLAEGLEKGRNEKSQEIARNLLSMGLSVEQIVNATGLTEEQISSLT